MTRSTTCASTPARTTIPPVTTGRGKRELNVEKIGEGRYQVRRSEVFALLEDPSQLQTPVRIAMEQGTPVGIRLARVQRGSVYEQIGLQRGDVINRINGYEITDMSKGLELYGKLKDANAITVDYTRHGVKKTLDYSILD